MGIQFFHLLALSVWIGGIIVIRAVVTPTLVQGLSSEQKSGILVREIFCRFNRAALICAGALIATGLIKFLTWENLTPWNLLRYLAVVTMSSICLYSSLKIFPQMGHRILKKESPPPLFTLTEGADTSPAKRTRLYRLSVRLMLVNLICGMTALLMA